MKKPRPKIVRSNVSFDYKEAVANSLISLEIPKKIADIAVIDLKLPLNKGFHGKKSPEETAKKMVKEIYRIYRDDTSNLWHYNCGPCSIVANAVVSKTKNVGSIPTKGANIGGDI